MRLNSLKKKNCLFLLGQFYKKGSYLLACIVFGITSASMVHAREYPKREVTATEIDFQLRSALEENDYEAFEHFLADGANPMAWLDDSQFGWVMCAATEVGREEFLRLLIDKGYDVNYRQVDISTAISLPLTCAVRFGNLEALKLLVEAGADAAVKPCASCLNRKPRSVMSAAVIVGKYDLAVWLFDKANYSNEQLETDIRMIERFPVNEYSRQNDYRLELAELLRQRGYEVTPWTRNKEVK